MEHDHTLRERDIDIPSAFVDWIVREIPGDIWVRTFQDNPILKASLLEGFSHRAHKPARLFRKPQFQAHMRRYLLSHPEALDEVMKVWGQENLFLVAFLEMLDRAFVLESFRNLKNLVGPEPFFAGLHLLGYLRDPEIRVLIREDFWVRRVNGDAVEPLAPVLNLWIGFSRQFPQAKLWLDSLLPSAPHEARSIAPDELPRDAEADSREADRQRKVDLKVERLNEEKSHLQEQVTRFRKDNEELRKKVEAWESSFEARVEEALAHHRMAGFRRYRPVDDDTLKEAGNRLEGLLKRADRAFELQREADARYGLVSTVRQKLLRVELYLKEMEKIYADSLVVHTDVSRVKEALLTERKRLLELPGIHKVLRSDPGLLPIEDLRQKIRFLEAEPENLSKIGQIHQSLLRLGAAGIIDDPQPLLEEIHQKKRQILEVLYARFQPPMRRGGGDESATSLDDLVESGQSAYHDVYVDGYNILLKVQGNRKKGPSSPSLTSSRDDFIHAVGRKARLFRKVYLVFDGVESHTDVVRNVEIIYTDKKRGETADSVIIQALSRRRDNRALLVTADREIIQKTEDHVYATVDPYHFYLFIFEIQEQPGWEAGNTA